jgi:hypothetical protein
MGKEKEKKSTFVRKIYDFFEGIINWSSDGKWRTFILMSAIGLFIYFLLFATVHRRSEADLTKNTPQRYNLLIQFWKERGYLKHGGLWIWATDKNAPFYWDPPKVDEPVTKIYRSYSMGHIMFANIAERLYMTITGKFSDKLMRFHNQFFVFLSSSLLGLLAFRIGKRAQIPHPQNMLMSLICLVIYQTFPANLFYFWEVYPSTIAIPFLLSFIILLESINREKESNTKKNLLAAVFSFFAFYIDPPTVGFFFVFLALCWLLLGDKESFKNNWHKITIYPAIAAMCVFALQILTVKINFPNAEMMGSGFLFRTGLDGSTAYYQGHSSLYKLRSVFYFLKWYFLFFGGVVSFFIFIFNQKHLKDNYAALAISSLLCIYFPVAFVISQGVSIHPYYFDAFLALPMILLLFCILPILLTLTNERWNGFILLFSIVGFCYIFVQLRTYMVTFPFIG